MAAMAKYMYGAIEESARSRGHFCDSLKTHKRTVPSNSDNRPSDTPFISKINRIY